MRLTARLAFLAAATMVLANGSVARGEEYQNLHVESKVYVVGQSKPITETTTIFHAGFVYDFLRDPNEARDPETTIFDPVKGRFVIIDPQRRLWTQVSTQDVKAFADKLRIEAAGHTDALLNFLAAPNFKEQNEKDELVFDSPFIVYRLKTISAKNKQGMRQYAEFSHWYAQLNPMLNPQSLPPFGRMAINDALEQREVLPVEVQMTLLPKQKGARSLSLKADHRFQWTLLEPDRQRIDEAGKQLAVFKQITLEEYNRRVNPAPPAGKGTASQAKN